MKPEVDLRHLGLYEKEGADVMLVAYLRAIRRVARPGASVEGLVNAAEYYAEKALGEARFDWAWIRVRELENDYR